MNFSVQRFIYLINNPVDHAMLDVSRDHCILDRAFLQNRYTESLSDTTVLLFFENLTILAPKNLPQLSYQ
jgi:hypothetical protein